MCETPKKVQRLLPATRKRSADNAIHPKLWINYSRIDLHRYVITSYSRKQELCLECVHAHGITSIILRGSWSKIDPREGDIIHIIGEYENSSSTVTLDDHSSLLLILEPDTLVSCTALSYPCRRRSILRQKIGGGRGTENVALRPRLLHEGLQEVFAGTQTDEHSIREVFRELAEKSSHAGALDTCTAEEILRDLELQIQKILDWETGPTDLQNLAATSPRLNGVPFSAKKHLASELSLWSPTFGLQGRVDSVVEVNGKVLGVEIKTSSFPPNRASWDQTYLYTLLLQERYPSCLTTIIYSIEHGLFARLAPQKRIRYLFQRRNQVVVDQRTSLPSPINIEHMCRYCNMRAPCKLYRHAQESTRGSTSFSLTSHEVEMFNHWDRLLSLEERERRKLLKYPWKVPNEEKELEGIGLAGLCVCSEEPMNDRTTIYTLTRGRAFKNRSQLKLHTGVSLGCHESPNVASGVIIGIRNSQVKVIVDTKLRWNTCYNLDIVKHEEYMKFSRRCLVDLFIDFDRRLLNILMNPPSDKPLHVSGTRVHGSYNDQQKLAVHQALGARYFTLIDGPPATGKSTIVTTVVDALIHDGKRVLICSEHVERVEKLVMRLSDCGIEVEGTKETQLPKPQGKCLVAAATLEASGLNTAEFDTCIVLDAPAILFPDAIRVIGLARRFMLVGDSLMQKPRIKSSAAAKQGLDSMFNVLAKKFPNRVITLTTQYRMNRDIAAFYSTVAGRELTCGTDSVATGSLKLNLPARYASWLEPSNAVVFMDTDGMTRSTDDILVEIVDILQASGSHDVVIVGNGQATRRGTYKVHPFHEIENEHECIIALTEQGTRQDDALRAFSACRHKLIILGPKSFLNGYDNIGRVHDRILHTTPTKL